MNMMLICLLCICVLSTTEAAPCKEKQQCGSCQENGLCKSKCNDGYYGPKCIYKCKTGCRSNLCHLEKGMGKCTKGCKPGFHGTKCNSPCGTELNTCSKCPQECEGGFCQLESSCARGCKDSFYGTACRSCPAGCKVCNRVSGTCEVCLHCKRNCSHGCTEGCDPGYSGEFCEHSCSSGCLSRCDQTSGACFKCKSGLYGKMCESKCKTGCANGTCYRNGTCTDKCIEGFYGEQCRYQCSPSCFNKLCHIETGSCKSCEKGFYGSHCKKSCVRCVNGSCTQDAGHCIQGCLPNYRGEFCQYDCEGNCTGDECNNICKTKKEVSRGTQKYLIFGVSIIFIIFLMVVVFVTFQFKRISNDLHNNVTLVAPARIRNAEPEDLRTCNTLSSLNAVTTQELDCSPVGVQVVVLKPPDAGSESLVSLQDKEVVDRRFHEDDLPWERYKARKLEVAENSYTSSRDISEIILNTNSPHLTSKRNTQSLQKTNRNDGTAAKNTFILEGPVVADGQDKILTPEKDI